MPELDKELVQILACPVGKKPLRRDGDDLVCTCCGTRYPIRDGIPVLLINEAQFPIGISSVEELKCSSQ